MGDEAGVDRDGIMGMAAVERELTVLDHAARGRPITIRRQPGTELHIDTGHPSNPFEDVGHDRRLQ